MEYFRHGSADSIDIDTFFVVDELSPLKHENAIRCSQLSAEYGVDGNIITIDRELQRVSGVFKGSVEEIHQSLLATYSLHEQKFPCPITGAVPRDIHLKMIRVLRGILSHCSRTEHRKEVKMALHSESIYEKLDILRNIRLSLIEDFGKNKTSLIDIHKFFAFQITQFSGLMRYPQVEIYTKEDACRWYPNVHSMIYRQEFVNYTTKIDDLQDDFIQACYTLLDSKKTLNVLQDGKLLRTLFGRLNVLTESYAEEI